MKGSRKERPKPCPECHGDLEWRDYWNKYTCTSCGLELTADQIFRYEIEIPKKKTIKDYVEWHLSNK